jgi:lipoyl(octanoyl) transferase
MTDLSHYDAIIACGLPNYCNTSLQHIGIDISMEQFDEILYTEFTRLFLGTSIYNIDRPLLAK